MKPLFLLFLVAGPFVLQAQSDTESGQEEAMSPPIRIYKYNTGSEACADLSDLLHDTPHAMQKVLNENQVTVLSSFRGYDGLMYSLKDLHCKDIPTISIFEVPAESHPLVTELGFQLCSDLQDHGGDCHPESYSDRMLPDKNKEVRRIYKQAEKKQCQADSGQSVQVMEEELKHHKIVVFQRYRGIDGLLHSLSCGSDTGEINIYVIEKSALAKALSLGYRECAYLEKLGGLCHTMRIP